jgi:protein-L-isoaspartate O-methyltransferase
MNEREMGAQQLMIYLKHIARGLFVVAFSLATASVSLPAPQAAPAAPPAQATPPTQATQPTQDTQKPFEPVSGQAGKDVVWVPTPQATVDKMLELAKVTPRDYVIDLGSGNGITVITAAKKGATAVGVEFNPDMVALSQRLAKEAGVSDNATFVKGDLFEADLSKASVVTLFLLPQINLRLRPKLLELKPGTRIASNTFTMGDWEPDAQATSTPCTNWCTALMWVVPAKVAGTWHVGKETLTLTQQYQMVTGTLGSTPISEGKLNGEQITFTAGPKKYTGRVNGTTISGSGWTATKG